MSKGTQKVLDKIDEIKVKIVRQMCVLTILFVLIIL